MEDDKKIHKKLDSLIMGVILGGAVGSVLGLTLAPRKGKETREMIKQKGGELLEKGKEVSQEFIKDHKEAIAGAKYQLKKGKGFFRWLFRKVKNQKMPRVTIDEENE